MAFGSKRRAAPIPHIRASTPGSPLPMASKARPDGPPRNSPKPQRLSSDGRFSSIAYLMAVEYFGVPAVRALFEATYLIGLRKAGMPED
jgi:hypothetical protein